MSPTSDTKNVLVLAENFNLSPTQLEFLNKGLTFVPTVDIGRNQKFQFQLDIQNYHRRIKLATFFRNAPKKSMLPFVGPSDWTPPLKSLPLEIKKLIHRDQNTFKKHYKFMNSEQNISSEEIDVLHELMDNKQIIIKPADKGSVVVIMGREQYIHEVKRQLNDATYYKQILKPIYLDTVPLIHEILDRLKNKKFINWRQRQYLAGNRQPRPRLFYILPKIHKDPNSWTIPFKIPPGRPIVSDCDSETYYTAEYLDFYLNPLATLHPSYVKDTYDFIKLIKSLRIRSDFYFFSMDVESLYTNIPIDEGIDCVERMFQKYPDPKRPDEELLELLRINLTRNDFLFDDQFYLQIKGTAMGKRFAPAYANIFMADWEEGALFKCKKQPAVYVRYLDDIFGIWLGSRVEFEEFVKILNSHDSSIKLKVQISKNSIDFLDTTIFKGANFHKTQKLDIKVYFKSTDTHALLHKNSYHPKHTFEGIIKSQLIRFKRICTRTRDFRQAVSTLFGAVRKRGYSRSFLRGCLKTFKIKKDRKKNNLIPLIATFSPAARILNYKFKNNFMKMTNRDNLIPNSEVISAYRRNKNLKDWLVRAKLPSFDWTKPLKAQKYFYKLKFIQNNSNHTIMKIGQNFTLKSKNCVYIIFCLHCDMKYVGETRNCLNIRLSQHLHNIKNKKELNTLFVQHFIGHGMAAVRMAGLEENVCWSDWERKKRERYWIYMVGTREPWGLNMKRY